MMKDSILLLLLIWCLGAVVVANSEATTKGGCSLCGDGVDSTLYISRQKAISVPGNAWVQTCGQLESVLPFLNPEECVLIQSISSICGCPTPKNNCQLCQVGNDASISILLENDKPLPMFRHLFGGFAPNCEMYQAYLHTLNATDTRCTFSQSIVANYCGCETGGQRQKRDKKCSLCSSNGSSLDRTQRLHVDGIPFETCGELNDSLETLLEENSIECDQAKSAFSNLCGCNNNSNNREEKDVLPSSTSSSSSSSSSSSCSVCADGSPVPFPKKQVPFLNPIVGIQPTCAMLDADVRAKYNSQDNECALEQAIGRDCGCPPVENHCVICDGEPLPTDYREKELFFLDNDSHGGGGGDTTTISCELFELLQYQIPAESTQCWLLDNRAFLCGCNDGVWDYGLGADTKTKQGVLAWSGRISATLSFLSSSALIVFIVSSEKRRRQIYNQIVAGMMVFHVVTAMAWMIGTAVVDRTIRGGDPSGIFGARGNDTSCQIGGFFIQLGLTSMFYFVSLLVYYQLVIVHGWKTQRLNKIRWWLHGIPLVVGFGLAFGGINNYSNHVFGCYFFSRPFQESERVFYITLFCLAPMVVSIVASTALTVHIYMYMRSKRIRSERWKLYRFDIERSTHSLPDTLTVGRYGKQASLEGIINTPSSASSIAILKTSSQRAAPIHEESEKSITTMTTHKRDNIPAHHEERRNVLTDNNNNNNNNNNEETDDAVASMQDGDAMLPQHDQDTKLDHDMTSAENGDRASQMNNDDANAGTDHHLRRERESSSSMASTARRAAVDRLALQQAIAYLLSFWITWPISVISLVVSRWDQYWFGVVVLFFGPLQGLCSCLVYFRPHVHHFFQYRHYRHRQHHHHEQHRRQQEQEERESLSNNNNNDDDDENNNDGNGYRSENSDTERDTLSCLCFGSDDFLIDDEEDPSVKIALDRLRRSRRRFLPPSN